MRPGLIRPGNVRQPAVDPVVFAASMRPGLIRPGNFGNVADKVMELNLLQ